MTNPSRSRAWLLGCMLCAVTVAAYAPILRAGFIWDDDVFLTQNPLVKTAGGLFRIWFTREPRDYWPVTYTAAWLEWHLWGLNAAGYHIVNLALHVVEALLLWGILARLRLPGAYCAALLFAVHPINVETVAWITQLKNLMAMLFVLLTVRCFLETNLAAIPPPAVAIPSRSKRTRLWYGLTLLAFALGMLSKGSAAMLPFALLGLIAWRRRISARDVAVLLPFFAVAALLTLVDVWFQKHGSSDQFRQAGVLERILGAGSVVWYYLYKILLPINLAFVYPQWHVRVDEMRWWIGLGATLGLSAILLRNRHTPARPLLFAWGYFVLMLVPVMGLVDTEFMRFTLVADHYAHLALIGVVATVAAYGARGCAKVAAGATAIGVFRPDDSPGAANPIGSARSATLGYVAAAGVVSGLAILTWRQSSTYSNAQTLYETTVQENPGCLFARVDLAAILAGRGRVPEAIAQMEAVLRAMPDDANMHNNLALLLAREPGREADAVAQYGEAVRLQPDSVVAHDNLALMLSGMPGRKSDALAQFEAALRLAPNNPAVHNNLALLLANLPGRRADAIAEYETALRLKPDLAEAHNDLAVLLASEPRRRVEAIAHFEAALHLRPDFVEAHSDLANILAGEPGHEAEAIAHYTTALRLRPDLAEAHNNLAVLLARQPGGERAAAAHFEAALRLKPDFAEAHSDYANLLATEPGREAEAIGHYESALRLAPGNAKAHYNFANLLARQAGHSADAIAEYEAALRLNPDYVLAHNNLAALLAREPGRAADAIAHFEAAARLDPGSIEVRLNLAKLLAREPGGQAEAIAQFEAALRLKPDLAEAHNDLAILLAQIPGHQDEAIEHFEAALRFDSGYADAHFNLAVVFARAGRLDEAARHLEQAEKIDPADLRTREFLDQIRAALHR